MPFDEGSLTGTLTADSTWPQGDFRNLYFNPENLQATLPRVERLRPVVPAGMTMPQLALRHILAAPGGLDGHPGHAEASSTSSRTSPSATASRCRPPLMAELKTHRWDRTVDFE